MARSRRSGSEMVFQHSAPVRVKRLKIQRAPSLKYLDVEKLSRAASAEFDYGYVEVNGKKSAVRAVVRKGMVVSLKHEECSGCEKVSMSKELKTLLAAVRRRLGPGGGGTSRPEPVAVFLQQQKPERSECVLVCWWFACFICCGFPSDDKWDCNTVGRSYENR